jgi:hypothetical protein
MDADIWSMENKGSISLYETSNYEINAILEQVITPLSAQVCTTQVRTEMLNSVSVNLLKPNEWKKRENGGEARLNHTSEFILYLKENTTLHHCKDQLVNAIYGNNSCSFENHTKSINTKCTVTDC